MNAVVLIAANPTINDFSLFVPAWNGGGNGMFLAYIKEKGNRLRYKMFEDRSDAGRRLAQALSGYMECGALVLAIPRGGVEVGCQVADRLKAEFDLLVVRKLPFPHNPESGFGAIAEDGTTVLIDQAVRPLSPDMVRGIVDEQKREVRRRIRTLRNGRSLPGLKDRDVILVDDGLAMGATMRAAVLMCKKRQAGKVVVAVPVAGSRVSRLMEQLADELVVLEQPVFFRAVAQVYRRWYDVTDEQVLELLQSKPCGQSIQSSRRRR